jgi:uncharacterized protein (DUF927 family)
LLAAGGEMATTYGVTGWPEGEASRAAGACFKRWLDERGGVGAGEDIRAVEQVRAFIAAHGASRFENVEDDDEDDLGNDPAPYGQRVPDPKIVNRAGFKQQNGDEWEYLILPDTWKNARAIW